MLSLLCSEWEEVEHISVKHQQMKILVRGKSECSRFVRIFDSQTKRNPAKAVVPDLLNE